MKKEDLSVYSSWIDGQIAIPKDPTGEWFVSSPARSDVDFARVVYSYAQIENATAAARGAQKKWSDLSIIARHAILKKMFVQLNEQKESLIQIAQNELGRAEADVLLEWKQIENWYASFSKFHPESDHQVRESNGVTAVIGSYVWPLFYSLHFTFLNLLAGNTVVLKPSEKATLTVLALAKNLTAISEAKSILQVVLGEKELGRRLACHEQVNNVIFTGSFEVGMRVRQDTLSQPSKEVLLYLGAKNSAILCEDFDPRAVDTLIQDCFLSTGQHCRSASLVFVHESRFSKFVDDFHQKSKEFKIGSPMSGAYTGPLIDGPMLDRYLKFIGISEREGAEIVMRGKALTLTEKGFFATPTLAAFEQMNAETMKKSISLQTEILSPHVSVIRYQNYDELLETLAPMNYGLCASIWGGNADRNQKIAEQLKVGNVVINQSLLTWDPAHSFQAKKKSGNHAYHGFHLYEQLTFLKSIQK